MPEIIENRMVVDSEWDEKEYGFPIRKEVLEDEGDEDDQ